MINDNSVIDAIDGFRRPTPSDFIECLRDFHDNQEGLQLYMYTDIKSNRLCYARNRKHAMRILCLHNSQYPVPIATGYQPLCFSGMDFSLSVSSFDNSFILKMTYNEV